MERGVLLILLLLSNLDIISATLEPYSGSGYNVHEPDSDVGSGSGIEIEIDCGPLEDPLNGNVNVSNTTVNSVANYSCIEGFVISGNTNRSCLKSGNWSGSIPECNEIDCGPLEDPLNGNVNISNTTVNSVANYSCTEGFVISGNTNRSCLNSGTWSGSIPECNVILEITSISEDVIAYRNDTVTLSCSGRGERLISVHWITPNGTIFTSNDDRGRLLPDYVWTADNYIISNISASDGGMYTCVAETIEASVNSSVVVHVFPYFTVVPSDILTMNGSLETALCSADGFPSPNMLWTSGNQEQCSQGDFESHVITESQVLAFNSILFGDETYVYCCLAFNQYGWISSDINVTISPYTSVQVVPQDPILNHNDSLNLTCTNEGGPGNRFSWKFNDTELDGIQGDRLVLSYITAMDNGGNYTCTVENAAGEGSDSVMILVTPIITQHPMDAFWDLNGQRPYASLMCNASAFPYPEYNWIHDNSELTESIGGSETPLLSFYEYTEGLEGDYYCTATSNNVTVVSNRATLYVPSFNAYISSVKEVYEEGDELILTCYHSGGPNNTYTWLKSQTVLNETGPILNLNITLADEDGGLYTCEITNPAGATSVSITVNISPVVFATPVDTFALFGETVNFTCGVRASPFHPDLISWSRSGGSIPNNSIVLSTGNGLSVLTIFEVGLEDHGEYNCLVIAEPTMTYSAVLTVFHEDGVMVTSSQSVYSPRANATFNCTSLSGPENSFQWFKDGIAITQLQTGETSSDILEIFNVSATIDGGEYTCVVNNSAGSSNASLELNISPEFVQFPSNVLSNVGVIAQFICEATAFPEPSYQWRKVDGELPANAIITDGTILTFPLLQYQNEGVYVCTATAYGISIETNASLIVSPENGVAITPNQVIFDDYETDQLRLNCTSQAMFDITFQWTYDTNDTILSTSPTLVIEHATARNNGGVYECTVTNAAGSGSDVANVLFNPTFILHPEVKTAENGSNITFLCAVSSFPLPTIEWFRSDNQSLPSSAISLSFGENSSLVIESIGFGDEGGYYCSATANNQSVNSLLGILYISPLGSVEVTPKYQVYPYGAHVTITCEARGGPNNTYEWIFNNTTIQIDPSTVFNQLQYDSRSILTIERLTPVTASNYTCNVQNIAGNGSDTVDIYLQPIIIGLPLASFTVVNSSVRITCLAQGNPLPDITWEYQGLTLDIVDSVDNDFGSGYDNDAIAPESKFKIFQSVITHNGLAVNSTLEISNIVHSDFGNYTCNASSPVNSFYSTDSNTTLTVSPQGSVTVEPSMTSVRLNDRVVALCRGEGGPDNRFTWESLSADGQKTFLQNGSTIVINVTEIDDRVYVCRVKNSAGFGEANLTIYIAPNVTDHPQNMNVSVYPHANFLHLNCCYSGFPIPSVQWYHNNTLLHITKDDVTMETQSNGLVVCNVLQRSRLLYSHSGFYKCQGTNIAGNTTSSDAYVLIQDRPEQPDIINVTNITSNSFVVRWTRPYSHNTPILGYTVYLEAQSTVTFNTTDTFLELTELLSGTVYMVSVTAVNVAGVSNPSEVVNVTTEAAPVLAPTNVSAQAVSSTQIMVFWTAVSYITGYISHYEVDFIPQNNFQGQISGGNIATLNISVILAGLEEFVVYEIRIRAHSNNGVGPYSAVSVQTLEDVPSAPPVGLSLQSQSSTSLFAAWSPPPEIDRNGNIISYRLEYTLNMSTTHDIVLFSTNLTLERLEIYTEYWVRVSASTLLGNGPFTQFLSITTQEDVPGTAPTDLHLLNVTSTTVELAWNEVPSESRNGIIIQYRIQYYFQGDNEDIMFLDVSGSNLTATIAGLQEYTPYSIQISAATSIGFGPFTIPVIIRTLEAIPSAPPQNVIVFVNNSTSLFVSWQPLSSVADENGMIIHYEVEYSSIYGQSSVEVDDLMMDLNGLEEYTEYSVRVSAHTSVGGGPFTLPVSITTPEDFPSAPPVGLSLRSQSSSSLFATWSPPPEIDRNGIIILYTLQYTLNTSASHTFVSLNVSGTNHTLESLEIYTEYWVRVSASTNVGDGPFTQFLSNTTQEDVPGAAPTNLRSVNVTSTTVELAWNEVPSESRNGIITHYRIQYYPVINDSGNENYNIMFLNVSGLNLSATIAGLEENTSFLFLISAATSVGFGPYSIPVSNATLEDVPSAPPQNVTVFVNNSTSLFVLWLPLSSVADENGMIIHYEVEYSSIYGQSSVEVDDLMVDLNGLEEYTEYSVRVSAHTSVGGGPFTLPVSNTTSEDLPSGPPATVNAVSLSSTLIQVAWAEVPLRHQNGIITQYEILYTQEGQETGNNVSLLTPTQLLYDLMGLEAFQIYEIRVRAFTMIGPGPYSEPVTAMSEEAPPSGPPLNVTSEAISSTSIRVMWDEVAPVNRNGIITGYDVQYSQSVFDEGGTGLISTLDRSVTLSNLHEFTEYSIQVRARTIKGPGPYSNITLSTTSQDSPAAPPEGVDITVLSSTSLLVSWSQVPLIDQNGIITHYEIQYSQNTFDLPPYTNIIVNGNNMSHIIEDLEEYVEYTVEVGAVTDVGVGPYSSDQATTSQDVPFSFPTNILSSSNAPHQVVLQWDEVNRIDQNGIIIAYEIQFNQSTVERLTHSRTVNSTTQQLSTTIGPLQPFIPYDVNIRAYTIVGHGPYGNSVLTVFTNPTGLSLSGETYYEVKEGEDLSVVCTPSVGTVALDWELPQSVLNSVSATTVYREPLRHTLTIRRANIDHNSTYTCVVEGDRERQITPLPVKVKVLEKCLEDFSGGLFWEVAFDGDKVSQPCKNADNRFSDVVRVYRKCLSNRRWTSVDFSGCVLANGDPLVLVIISLRTITSNEQEIDVTGLQNEMVQAIGSSVPPASSSLDMLSQTLNQHSLFVFKMTYTTVQEATNSQIDSFFCNGSLGFSTPLVPYGSSAIVAFTRSDFCECRNIKVIENPVENTGSGGHELCPQQQLSIQELCNGTRASPCNCQPFSDCLCMSPYIGDGSLCVLDSDLDGYPDRALRSCSSGDTQTYCSEDTCTFAPNVDQNDRSPCIGDETDCEEETDSVWNILWPFTPGGMTAIVSCGVDFVGNATRFCQSNLLWADPNVTNCQSRVFIDIMERAEVAIENADTEVVLEVVEELVVATEQEDTPQLPRDLNTTNEIITDTLDLLFNDLDAAPADNQTNVTVTIEAATVVFEALDNILSQSNQVSFQSLQEAGDGVGSQAVLMNAKSFGLLAARVLASDDKGSSMPNRVVNISGVNMALRAQSVAVNEDTMYSFPSPEEIKNLALPNATLANISLSSSFLEQSLSAAGGGSTSVVVASVLFATLQSFLPSSSSEGIGGEPASLIISTQIAVDRQKSIGSSSGNDEEGGVMIGFMFPTVEADPILERRIAQCVFYDFGTGPDGLANSGWSTDNVTTLMETTNGSESSVSCASSHLTSFAVLVDVQGVEINNKPLSIVSYIGLGISSVCLMFSIIFFLSLRKKLFTALHNFVHLNLAIALLAGYIVFAIGVELAIHNMIGCKAVTAMIQYFFLSAFSWMLCEGVMLYLMLVKVFTTLKNKWWFFFLLGWGIPLPFLVIGLGAFHDDYGVKDITGKFKYCWLSSGSGSYAFLTFVIPMLIIILINVVFLVLVLRSIFKSKHNQRSMKKSMKGEKKKKPTDTPVQLLKATVILLPLLGLTWVFGLLAVNRNTIVFAWLFTIFNTLQGFFIFFFHVLRNKVVSTGVKRRYTKYSSAMTSKFGTLTSTLRSPTSSTSTLPRQLRGSSSGSIFRSRTSSFSSEAESVFKNESIIVRNPHLPAIAEEGELELRLVKENDYVMFTTMDLDEEEEEESSFGTVVVETKSITVIKSNPGALMND